MDEERTEARKRLGERMADYRLPRWEELPDLELYMDQVLSLVERYLGDYPGFEERRLTASMVNNYVKMGVMPPPVKKRYSRVHLAYLLMICLLKAALPIAAIRALLLRGRETLTEEKLYDAFCRLFQEENAAAAELCPWEGQPTVTRICRAALRAQAEQALALEQFRTLERDDISGEKGKNGHG